MNSKQRYENLVASLAQMDLGLAQRELPFDGGALTIFYVRQLTDRVTLSEQVVKPLVLYFRRENAAIKNLRVKDLLDDVIYLDDCEILDDDTQIIDNILSGMTVLLLSTDERFLVLNLKMVAHRPVAEPAMQFTLRGPKDCFVENMDVNLSLIRYRVKDPKLRIVTHEVGERTPSKVAVIYIEDIANNTVVGEVQKRIDAIHVDGITESGELQAFLLNRRTNLFPQMGLIERSDTAYTVLMEGKVLVIVEGSGIVLVAPRTLPEFFYSCDERYDNKYLSIFIRAFRYIAVLLSMTASSLYVGLSSFHADALPSQYIIALAQMRAKVPFTALVGALLLEFIVELVREALMRVPKQIGPAVGIVSGIVIGQAAIAAGLFSPLLMILVSASLLASFVMPDYSLMNPLRLLKFTLLIVTGMFGFYGSLLFLFLILIQIVSVNSFGVPYLAPYAPFNLYDFLRSFISNKSVSPLRPQYLRSKDDTRMKT